MHIKVGFKGIGSQTYTLILYKSLKVAGHFAANFMKIDEEIRKLRKLYGFKHFGGLSPKRGCECMTSLPHNHKITNISHFRANITE